MSAQGGRGVRVNAGRPKRPASDAWRIRMFLDLVADHEYLMEALPAPAEVQLPLPMGGDPHYVPRIVRAASIRKFVEAPQDQVYLTKVFDSLESLLEMDARQELALKSARDGLANFPNRTVATFHYGDEPPRTAHDVVDDLLNGRFVHADFTKYQWSNVHRRFGPSAESLLTWLAAAERMVLRTKLSIEEWRDEGALTLTEEPPSS